VVDSPSGLTVAFNVAEFEVMLVAEVVVAVGAAPAVGVLNDIGEPYVVPLLLVATIR